MKILITGSEGQVGRCLVKQLHSMKDVEYLALNKDDLDITDRKEVDKTVNEFKPDAIINAAAYTAVDQAEENIELAFSINSDGPKYLAIAANHVGALMLHISTDYVFSGNKEGVYCELDSPSPKNIYGKSKYSGEREVAKHCPRHIILRTSWVFSEYGSNFVKSILRLSKEKDELSIVCDQFGGPTYAGDISNALLVISKSLLVKSNLKKRKTEFGIYHYSGFPHVSWYEFASCIIEGQYAKKETDKEIKIYAISSLAFPTKASRPKNSKLNCLKIEAGFSIKMSDWKKTLNDLNDDMS